MDWLPIHRLVERICRWDACDASQKLMQKRTLQSHIDLTSYWCSSVQQHWILRVPRPTHVSLHFGVTYEVVKRSEGCFGIICDALLWCFLNVRKEWVTLRYNILNPICDLNKFRDGTDLDLNKLTDFAPTEDDEGLILVSKKSEDKEALMCLALLVINRVICKLYYF